ncbi:MAG: NfeD family protein [Candidatus Limnocylindrales bacterium]
MTKDSTLSSQDRAVGGNREDEPVIGRSVRMAALLLVSLGLLLVGTGAARAATPRVIVLPLNGIVDQAMAGYVLDGLAQAASEGAAAVVLEIDTPGGDLDATRSITGDILASPVPVITWVAPDGARAASAGTFIVLSGGLALMAPGTNIGAAAPVDSNGQDITGTEGLKVLNDTIANITAIAQARHRPVAWAVSTVRDAASFSATAALSAGAVDGLAATLPDVLAFASGRHVQAGTALVTLDLAGAQTEQLAMNPLQQLLHLLSDPNLAFVLFVLGAYGLILEFVHPNLVTGALGGVALILAYIGFGSLPLNLGGLLLIVLALALFVLDLTVTSHGAVTLVGLGCFVLGAGALYTQPGPAGTGVGVAWPIIAAMSGMTALFMLVVVATAWRIRHRARLPIGIGGSQADGTLAVPVGSMGSVRQPLGPAGTIYANGEEWSARSADGRPYERGASVRVLGQDGLVLLVEGATPGGSARAEVAG